MNHIFVAINILNETEKRQRCLIIIFNFTVMYVCSMNYIFAAIDVYMKTKRGSVFDILSYCNTVDNLGELTVPFA